MVKNYIALDELMTNNRWNYIICPPRGSVRKSGLCASSYYVKMHSNVYQNGSERMRLWADTEQFVFFPPEYTDEYMLTSRTRSILPPNPPP